MKHFSLSINSDRNNCWVDLNNVFGIDGERQAEDHLTETRSPSYRSWRSTYLQTVEEHCCQAQPAVQTVHVGDLGAVVEVKHRHQGYDNQSEGQEVQAGVDELHHQFAAAPGPGQAVDHDGCKRRVKTPGSLGVWMSMCDAQANSESIHFFYNRTCLSEPLMPRFPLSEAHIHNCT